MANIFLISDTHFGHENILSFTRPNGERLRAFASVEEMDNHMVECWNRVVGPYDKVYHLGDVAIRREAIKTIGRCNGKKRLVRGNHDDHDLKHYLPYFQEIYATRVLDGLIFSHIPIHADSLGRFVANVHGHVHNNVPALHFGPRYFNVSVEVIDYTPMPLEEVKRQVTAQLGML